MFYIKYVNAQARLHKFSKCPHKSEPCPSPWQLPSPTKDTSSPIAGLSKADTPGSLLRHPSTAHSVSLRSCPQGDWGAVCAPAQDGEVINASQGL